MSEFKKGRRIVRIITIPTGVETASLGKVEFVRKGEVRILGDSHLLYDSSTGREIDPVIPGCNSRIIALED